MTMYEYKTKLIELASKRLLHSGYEGSEYDDLVIQFLKENPNDIDYIVSGIEISHHDDGGNTFILFLNNFVPAYLPVVIMNFEKASELPYETKLNIIKMVFKVSLLLHDERDYFDPLKYFIDENFEEDTKIEIIEYCKSRLNSVSDDSNRKIIDMLIKDLIEGTIHNDENKLKLELLYGGI